MTATEKTAPTISARVFQPSTNAGALKSAGSVFAWLPRVIVSHSVLPYFARPPLGPVYLLESKCFGSAGFAGAIPGVPSFCTGG